MIDRNTTGSEDIVNGNQKLILGLIWHLILRYQIGKTKFPPKKLMLAWLQAVIPDCNISNFTSDWNDGVALHALLEYCKPGLCPNWKQLSRQNRLENCSNAMHVAKNEFNIPIIVRPEDFSSPHLDDLSGMTYLSYYMTVDSPGYHATLRDVRSLLKHGSINNFTTDWHDGKLLCNITKSLGVEPQGWPNMTSNNVENLQAGMDSAKKLGIEPILSAKEMSDPDVEHLGIMAYAAYFTRLTPRKVVAEKASVNGDFSNVQVGQEKSFRVSVDSDVLPHDVRAEIIGPDSIVPVRMNWSGKTANCTFTPTETGNHKLNVYCEGQVISECPINFKVTSDRSRVSCRPIERCPMGVVTDMKVDTSAAGRGNVQIEARSPSGRVHNLPVSDNGGIHNGNFNPTEVGEWQMNVTYDGQHVGGSPYTVKVFDPNAVDVYGLDGGAVGKALAFNVDSSRAGDGDLDVTVNYQGQNIPCYTTQESNGHHKINFTPQGAGSYKVNVRFAGEEVPKSPFTLEIVDSSMVSVTGDGLSLVPVNRPATFNVQTQGAGGGNINVDVVFFILTLNKEKYFEICTCDLNLAPNGKKISKKIIKENEENYRIEYYPEEAGDYKITVYFYDQPLRGSPFTCKVYDLGKLTVRNMPKTVLAGNLVLFDIDASLAGSGNIEIRVNEGRVACSVENKGGHQFVASFLPEAPITHYVEMTFNNAPVDGSAWKVYVMDPQQITASGSGLELIPINHRAHFKIHSDGSPLDDVKIIVKAPNDETITSNITLIGDDIRVEYTPTEVGDHEIRVICGESQVNGSPFIAKAYDTSAIVVDPPDDGYVNKPIYFSIDVQDAGEGQLQIMVNNGNLPNEVEVQDDGIYSISFIPVESGPQTIDISFNEEHLPGTPLTCNARDLSLAMVNINPVEIVNRQTEFVIQTKGNEQFNCAAQVFSPMGQKVPVQITGNSASGFRVEYTPRDIGTYTVTASLAGIPIKGSPFRVKSFDPTQVKVSKMPQGIVGIPCKFIVDASSAGEGTLELTVGAHGRNIPNQARSLGGGRYEVSFVGRQAVKHQANITYNGIPVPGCPFEIDFLDASRITADGEGLSLVSCHRSANFTVHAPGAAMPDLSVRVMSPDGRETPARIRQKNDDTFSVEWTPHMIGDHRVVVEYAEMSINGSPYIVKAFDASMVKVSHIGQGYLGRPVPFTLDASEAGDGNLEIQVTADHDSVPNYVRQDGDMSFKVSFTPQKARTHHVNIRFNGEPVPGSPFQCRILDSDRVIVSNDSVKQIPSGVLASFKVDPQDAGEGDLEVKVISPTGHEIPARISGSSHSNYKVDYTPQEIGRYKVYVEYGGVEVKGSPFISNVYDPSLVKVEYPNRAYLGRPIYFHVDASAAGQGELAAEIKSHGQLVPSQFREVGVGRYELSFTPKDMSTHNVTALFNNYPIPGSPFHVDVIDTSSVTMSGQGLRSAQVYRETWFNLDLHGMDDTDLDVQIVSPSGHELPCKLSRKGHICRAEFTPMEVGSHFIDVFFAGNKLHGSPFISHAFDPSLVRITDVDRTGKKEREIGFTVDASMAGVGELEAVVTHNGHKVQTYRESIDEGRYRYTFNPGESGHYEVNATFNEEPIPGCPVVINVEDEIPTFITISFRSVEALNVNEKNHHFMLHMNGKQIDMNLLNIAIQAPSGEQVPAHLVTQPNGDYKVEWTPNVAGRHMVDVSFAGQQIQGSPFYIEVFDIARVRVDNFYNGNVNEPAGFTVDGTRAGKAEQTLMITSPSGRTVPFEIVEGRAGEHNVTYRPVEVGKHKIQVAYGGLDVNDTKQDSTYMDNLFIQNKIPHTWMTCSLDKKQGSTYMDNLFIQNKIPHTWMTCSLDKKQGSTYMDNLFIQNKIPHTWMTCSLDKKHDSTYMDDRVSNGNKTSPGTIAL
ncbi:hypothetical protein LOTGIDRAFT_231195 [Lottia gigantea]|uniref:Calponin-homology (CH) domain-containing protein n=1 Tax=Lottia gigantea TaxID=225164 RepID=V4CAL0_LOTGI|nr:hypothetical protein LOTGIDRAFT_231195 [Lottia gigantea]ESO98829.1 hypothetical protein LOTGIDRAFT_231195 [Lottia gigantea]